MFDSLSKKLTNIFDKISGKGILSEKEVDESLKEIKIALLEADVALEVAKEFIDSIKKDAIGKNIIKSVSAGEMMVKIVFDHLLNHLKLNVPEKMLDFKGKDKPICILMAGLQGSGKTTTSAKLAMYIRDIEKHQKIDLKNPPKKIDKNAKEKNVLLVSLDIYRPAAMEQLQQLGELINIKTLPIIKDEKIMNICKRAFDYAFQNNVDVIIFDTAGRLHINSELMEEIKDIKDAVKPVETLLVIDSMMGQDAVKTAQEFNNAIDITGIILTRIDGDARGGAALSVTHITKKPIKFMGVGEKPDQFEEFDPDRVASRILDMGDILSFVEKTQKAVDQKDAEEMKERMKKGKFDLNDMENYLVQMDSMGGLMSFMKMMPGFGRMESQLQERGISDKLIKRQIAIIRSMTKKEKENYKIINGLRRRRIAMGAGVEIVDVNKLIKQYENVKEMMQGMGMLGGIKGKFGKMFGNLF